MAQLLFLLIGILLMAGTLAALLPTTFQRAFLVTLCYLLVAALVGGTLALVVLAAAWSVAIP